MLFEVAVLSSYVGSVRVWIIGAVLLGLAKTLLTSSATECITREWLVVWLCVAVVSKAKQGWLMRAHVVDTNSGRYEARNGERVKNEPREFS